MADLNDLDARTRALEERLHAVEAELRELRGEPASKPLRFAQAPAAAPPPPPPPVEVSAPTSYVTAAAPLPPAPPVAEKPGRRSDFLIGVPEIRMPKVKLPSVSAADLVGARGLALAFGLAGTATAVVTLPARSVGTTQLKNGAVTPVKIHRGAVRSAQIANRSVQPVDLSAAARVPVLGPNSVAAPQVADGSLRLADLAVSSRTLDWTPIGFTVLAHDCIGVGVGLLDHQAGDVVTAFNDETMADGLIIPDARQTSATSVANIRICNFTAGSVPVTGTSLFVVLRP
jgi:hypothetical protein